MCDLIDLSSPDPQKFKAISKLASPLIPGPPTPAEKNHNNDFVSNEKRSSLTNNPFDKVFKETAEYAAKKDDPFESVLERAQQNAKQDYMCKEDFAPKKRRHSEILKMNKTLDEPLLQGILNKNFQLSRQQNEQQSFSKDLNDANLSYENRGTVNSFGSFSIIVYPPSPGNCSVLNQSAMNDSLSEGSSSSGETERKEKLAEKSFGATENEQNDVIQRTFNTHIETKELKYLNHRRSLSQGTKILPESPEREIETQFRPRSRSIVDRLKVSDILSKSRVGSSVSSGNSANNAFIETVSTSNSELFDLSKSSAAQRLSYSLCRSVESFHSCSSKNRAFILDSQSSSRILGSTSSTRSSLNLSSISRTNGTGNLLIKTPLKTPAQINDLELRLEKLKIQSTASIVGLPSYSPNRKVQNFLRSDAEESGDGRLQSNPKRDAKLIDTDGIASPLEEGNCNIEKADSVSSYSSDSVFVENSNADQSVFREARILARTFDELAHQTSNSFSSGDDLLYSRPKWNFDVLPVSDDDEPVVDNLIELPVSPAKNEAVLQSGAIEDGQQITTNKLAESKVSEEIRELETEFLDQDIARNKVMAATLLLDLEKIVHRENNPEAITLLENLEKVLGVKYESNAQLLATCLQGTNNLSKSPKKSVTKLDVIENIRHESLEKSDEDNNDTGLSDSIKISNICNNVDLEMNLNVETAVNKSEKSIITELPSAIEENEQNLAKKAEGSSKVLVHQEKVISVDQTEALELITNLSKILGGLNNDSSPLSLLTNLRQVLNLATSQLNFENSQATKPQSRESLKVVRSEIITSQERPAAKPGLAKTNKKQSIDSSTKIQSTVPIPTKRSMSFSGGQRIIVPTATISKEKMKPHSRSFKKALSCDAVPKSEKLEKLASIAPEVIRGTASETDGPGKYKLKKKSESERVTGKKGPLKALLPLGTMQRRGSISTKVAPISLARTPPKSNSIAPTSFQSAMSSTPNPIVAVVSKKSPKTKPVASSTPDGVGSKARRIRLQFSKNTTKPKFSCNISPVTPLPTDSITGSISSKSSPKSHRHNKTLSPPKTQSCQEALALNTTESSIPKYSPLSGFVRRNSKESVRTLESSGSPKTSSTQSRTPKKSLFVQRKSQSQIPQSPLKTTNHQNAKFKPFNLISKLRRGSNGSTVSDKENCA